MNAGSEQGCSPPNDDMAPADVGIQLHRAEWKSISAEYRAANAKCSEISKAASGRLTDAVEAAEETANVIQCRLDACARRIWQEPVRSIADLRFLAEVCRLVLWADEDLASTRADAALFDIREEAIVALLKGVRDIAA